MKSAWFIFLASVSILFLSRCASRSYEADKANPTYQSGNYTASGPSSSAPPDAHLLKDSNLEGTTAAAGLIASGIALAANRDYYKQVAITGKVVCRSSAKAPIQFPCNNVEVVLLDETGKKLTQIEPTNGEFAFQVPENKPFRVKIDSAFYRMKPAVSKNLLRGDDIILNLLPVRK